jgi:hypothetical protein
MKINILPEPELEFGYGYRHPDIKFGLMNYGPLDIDTPLAPQEIKLGIVGTAETVEGVQRWFERCREEIPAKPSKQPHLFPRFPGFNQDAAFHSTLVLDDRLVRTISPRTFEKFSTYTRIDQIVEEAVELFLNELRYLAEHTPAGVLICAVPQALLDAMDNVDDIAYEEEGHGDEDSHDIGLNFHHLLKARAMPLRKPIQLIIPSTYDDHKRRPQKRRQEQFQRPQDEATRAWNIHTALYYKARGTPWRLIRDPKEYATCYVGIVFYHSLDQSRLLTSVAQVFNERGEGIAVRGGAAYYSKDDKQIHLQGDVAEKLLTNALARYREEHKTLPARIVVHKSSRFNTEEVHGFQQAATNQRVEFLECISISDSSTKLFRQGQYPPLRGTLWSLSEDAHILYTKGGVDFFETYPGLYVPRPLSFRCASVEQTPLFLAGEILALTKMNWNNTQFDGKEPITLRAARQVSDILKYVGEDDLLEPHYSFYM